MLDASDGVGLVVGWLELDVAGGLGDESGLSGDAEFGHEAAVHDADDGEGEGVRRVCGGCGHGGDYL